MKKLLARVDRIRSSGTATLEVSKNSPYYKFNGNKFTVHSMGIPDYKCRVTLIINGVNVHLTIDQVR